MADKALSHLNYGHAGAPTFDLETREWSFGRDFTTTKLKQIGILEDGQPTASETIPASIQFPSTAASTRLTDAKERAQALAQSHPELAPATHFLPELAVTSAAVLSATATYDPSIGSLFSIGSITYRYDRGARGDKWELPKRVAATVTGEAGNVLRLSFLCKEVHGWSDDRSVCIGGDTLRDPDSGYWNEEAAPIQQVCFSQSEDRSRLLAVRLLTRTVVFRPIYTHPPQPAAQSPYYNLPISPIQLHPVLSLNIKQSGGCPHADVTFNPDYQLQFAVVDQASVWSIWDIENKRQGNEYAMSCLVQGPIAEDVDLAGEDGWARVLWVGDHNTLLVCNRRLVAVIDFKRGTFQHLTCPQLVSPKSSDWILDVQRHPSQRGRVFVLTSTSLYILAVTTSNEAVDTTAGEIGARVLASWRHYRGAEDFTLRINIQMLHDDQVWVMVQSRLSPLTQVYTFRTSTDLIAAISSANATRLELAVDGEGHTIQSIVEPLQIEGDTESSSDCLALSYMAQGMTFFKLLILRSDLSVHEAIVYSATRGNFDVQDVAWSKTMQVGKGVRTSSIVQEMDDFLEAERIEAMDGPVSKLASQTSEWVQREPLSAARRVVDHMQLYDVLTQTDAITIDIATVTTQLKELLTGDSNISDLPMGTLNEFAGIPVQLPDVDEASSLLQGLTAHEDEDDPVTVRQIASTYVLNLGEDDQTTISSIYDNILQDWIAPLPSDVPPRVRQRKERLARRVAAEVMLACTRIRQRDSQAEAPAAQPSLSQDSAIAMPILSSQPLAAGSADPIWMSSQPSQKGFSSQTRTQSQSQPSASSSSMVDPLARLGKYLKLRDDGGPPPQTNFPPSVTQLLSHWQSGVDPSTYDWEAIERADRVENLDETTQQRIEKARKKKERRERRQQRENELAQSKPSSQPFAKPQLPSQPFVHLQPSSQLATFLKPATFPQSSPGPMLGSSIQRPYTQIPLPGTAFGSQSEEFPSTLAAQSQVEPGRFGGRPDKKKKKKKNRVSGF